MFARADECSDRLTKRRVGRKPAKSLATQASIGAYGETSSFAPHSSDRGQVHCMALHPDRDGVVATGGADKAVVLWDSAEGRQVTRLEGLGKAACFVGVLGATEGATGAGGAGAGMVLAGSGAGDVLGWRSSSSSSSEGNDEWGAVLKTAPHGGAAIVAGAVHPAGDLVLTAGSDGRWAGTELSRGTVVCGAATESSRSGASSSSSSSASSAASGAPVEASLRPGALSVHPDGGLVGVATGPVVEVWDLRASGVQMKLHDPGQAAAVRSLAFNENGYLAATGDAGGAVRLWDVRQPAVKHMSELAGAADAAQGSGAAAAVADGVRCVRFDWSGRYLGVALGGRVEVLGVKRWKQLASVVPQGEGAAPCCLGFGKDAKTMFVGGGDRLVRVFEAGAGSGQQGMQQ